MTKILRDSVGLRIVPCEKREPHGWHGWVGGNEDLRCPGLRGFELDRVEVGQAIDGVAKLVTGPGPNEYRRLLHKLQGFYREGLQG